MPERNRAVEDSHQKNYLAAPRFARIVRFAETDFASRKGCEVN